MPYHPLPPDQMLKEAGRLAYVIISLVLLLEAVPVLGAFIPAQLFILAAGFMVAQRELHLSVLLIVATLSLFVADVVSFALGRHYGTALLRRLPAGVARKAHELSHDLGNHLKKTLILGKFLGPARALAPPLAGNAKVPWHRFLPWEFLGCLVWVVVLTALGILFGASYRRIEHQLGRDSIVLLILVVGLYIAFQRFRAAKQEERQRPDPPLHEER